MSKMAIRRVVSVCESSYGGQWNGSNLSSKHLLDIFRVGTNRKQHAFMTTPSSIFTFHRANRRSLSPRSRPLRGRKTHVGWVGSMERAWQSSRTTDRICSSISRHLFHSLPFSLISATPLPLMTRQQIIAIIANAHTGKTEFLLERLEIPIVNYVIYANYRLQLINYPATTTKRVVH